MWDMLCESDSDPVSVCHPGVMSVTQNRTLHGSERGQGCAMAHGGVGGGGVIHVGSAPASAVGHQSIDKQKCPTWRGMVSRPSVSRCEASSFL